MAEQDDNFFSRWSRRKVLVREGVPVAPVPEAVPEAMPALTAPPLAVSPLPLPLPLPLPSAPLAQEVVETPAPPVAPPAPTLADVAELTSQSDYTRFVAQGVAPEVKNAALKKLFTDPHFNVMDGLDTYIEDYGVPDPLPEGMLRKMVQSKMLQLFDDDPEEAPAVVAAPPEPMAAAPDEADPRTSRDTAFDGAPDTVPDTASDIAPDTAPRELNTPDEDTAVQLQPDPAAGRPCPEQGAGENAGRQH